jgi:hypothetical protein
MNERHGYRVIAVTGVCAGRGFASCQASTVDRIQSCIRTEIKKPKKVAHHDA